MQEQLEQSGDESEDSNNNKDNLTKDEFGFGARASNCLPKFYEDSDN